MMRKQSFKGLIALFILAVILLTSRPSHATTYTVATSGGDYTTIQLAIDNVNTVAGDVIEVTAGTWYPFDFKGKAVTVKSISGAALTVLDGLNANLYTRFATSETSASILDGFTLTNTSSSAIIISGSSPTIKNCIITGNTGGSFGAGVRISGSTAAPTFINCTISYNTALYKGGGMYIANGSNVTMTDCTISNNTVTSQIAGWPSGVGGGIFALDGVSLTLTRCTISSNSTLTDGGGIFGYLTIFTNPPNTLTMNDCVVNGNSAARFAGVYFEGNTTMTNCNIVDNSSNYSYGTGVAIGSANLTLANCTLANNSYSTGSGAGLFISSGYSFTALNCNLWTSAPSTGDDIYKVGSTPFTISNCNFNPAGLTVYTDGGGNINADPLYVNATDQNPLLRDYHLKLGSPSIDAGTVTGAPATDIDGLARTMGLGVDMGSSERGIEVDWRGTADYTTISAAITAAVSGDAIIVHPGNYTGNLSYGGKDLYISSVSGPNVTKIWNPDVTCVSFISGETSAAVLDGFTISQGNDSGIVITDSSPTIKNCVFTENNGGIAISGSLASPIITNCTIVDNDATLRTITDGGGIYVSSLSTATVTNCTLSNNNAVNGGGIAVDATSSVAVTNSIIYGNTATTSGNDLYIAVGGTATVNYSDLDQTVGVSGTYTGTGNLNNKAPLFVDDNNTTISLRDYHIYGTSPCLDTGTLTGAPADDIDGDTRAQLSGIDIGSDEVKPINVPADQYTIQAAIDAAVNGDVVLVSDGTYRENIDYKAKDITVKSENGAASTTIDGNSNGSVVTFSTGASGVAILDGFTVKNGTGTFISPALRGGGILCQSGAYIKNCIIDSNTAVYGGGIYSETFTAVRVFKTTISNNQATSGFGGGVYFGDYGVCGLTDCNVIGNSAANGAGTFFATYTIIQLPHCTISGNTASNQGGGIYAASSASLQITNTILYGDTATTAGNEIFKFDGTVTDSVTYSDVQQATGVYAGTGNINADPQFVGGGDYHLSSISPCINTGTNMGWIDYDDIDGDARPIGVGFDIGADEAGFTYYTDADLDTYGDVNDTTGTIFATDPGSGWSQNNTDCDDGNININPATVWYLDIDGDGYSDGTTTTPRCARPTYYYYAAELIATSGDCDDYDAAVNPGATEICGNGIDDDCVGGDLVCADDHGNDSSTTTTSTVDGTTTAGVIDTTVDEDWFNFTPATGTVYLIRVTLGTAAGSTLDIVSNDGVTVITSASGTGATVDIYTAFSTAGTYFANVSSLSASTGSYSISVSAYTPTFTSTASDAALSLSWGANPAWNHFSYKLYIGTTAGGTEIINGLDIGNVTSQDTSLISPPVTLINGYTCYIRVSYVDDTANEYGYTQEIYSTPYATGTATTYSYQGGPTNYQMVSFPMTLTNPDPIYNLGPILNPGPDELTYDPSIWRLYAYYLDCYEQPSNYCSFCTDIIPGRGFWIVSLNNGAINLSGSSVDSSSDYSIFLQTGWSMIGNPFNFPVDVASLKVNDGFSSDVGFKDTGNTLTRKKLYYYKDGGYVVANKMQPGRAYWIKNISGSSVTLKVPPIRSTTPSGAPKQLTKAEQSDLPPSPPEGAGNNVSSGSAGDGMCFVATAAYEDDKKEGGTFIYIHKIFDAIINKIDYFMSD